MSKRVKTLLIVGLVLFLCCFGGSLGNPFGGEGSGQDSGFVKFLGRFAGGAAVVPDDAIQAPCRTEANQFQFTGTCALTIEGGGTGMRNLNLRSNRAMTVTSRVPRKDFTVSSDVAAGEQVTVAIDSEGGQVALTCAPLQTCVVAREDGS